MPTDSDWLATVPYSGKTRLIFIIGDPIAQAKSPAGLTKHLRTQGIDLIVIPAQVAEVDFNDFIRTTERMKNVAGLIITAPHKFAAHQLCTHLDPVAARVGSVNLMRFREEEG